MYTCTYLRYNMYLRYTNTGTSKIFYSVNYRIVNR